MDIDEKFIDIMAKANNNLVTSATTAISEADKYNKRLYVLMICCFVSFTLIICTMVYCYFDATYNENYRQEIIQTIEQDWSQE